MQHFRWFLALAFLTFGLASVGNWTSPKWIALTVILYSVPLVAQFSRQPLLRAYGQWFGGFLVLQTLLTPLVIDRDYFTLPPNMVQRIDVRGDAIPGISGLQTITTDQRGFRVTKPINYENKAADTFRIFAIGGSTTEEILLDDLRTWTHGLQAALDQTARYGNVEVINTGVSGTRARHHLATLKHVLQWEPDAVLFLAGINDWNRAIWDVHGAPDRHNPGVPQSAIQFSDTMLGRALRAMFGGKTESVASDKVQPEYGEYYSSQNDSLSREDVRTWRPDAVSPGYAKALDTIAATCGRHELRCVFLTQPTSYSPDAEPEMRRHYWMTPPNTDYTLDIGSLAALASLYNGHVLDLASRTGLRACDLAAQLEPALDVFYDDCHFNATGAQRVAERLADCLQDGALDSAGGS